MKHAYAAWAGWLAAALAGCVDAPAPWTVDVEFSTVDGGRLSLVEYECAGEGRRDDCHALSVVWAPQANATTQLQPEGRLSVHATVSCDGCQSRWVFLGLESQGGRATLRYVHDEDAAERLRTDVAGARVVERESAVYEA